MNFFNTLHSIGKLQAKRPGSARSIDPDKHARNLFIAGTQKQLNSIDASEIGRPGSWIVRHGNDYLVSLRYQLVPIRLDGENVWLRVDSIEKVKQVLISARDAAAAGEFDETFRAMARLPRKAGG